MDQSSLHPYQNKAIDFAYSRNKVALWLEMGLGKTVITLTTINKLLKENQIKKTLIVAPKSVAEATWHKELPNWSHLEDLSYVKVLGTEPKRIKALSKEADIHIINRENIVWLVKFCASKKNNTPWIWDMVVLDEASSFKSFASQRFKAINTMYSKINRMIQLTGTATPNGLEDVWSQIKLLDNGQALGKNITKFRRAYFNEVRRGSYSEYIPIQGASETVQSLLKERGLVLSMEAKDYLNMPEAQYINEYIDLPNKVKVKYKEMKTEFVSEIKDSKVFTKSAAETALKLLQFTGGNIYHEGDVIHFHDEKYKCLERIIERHKDENILVAYSFKSDLEALKKRFKDIVILRGADKNINKVIDKWNSGKIKLMAAHPASTAYGLNIQAGGRILVWHGLTWDLEKYQQFNARLYRQGQKNDVKIYHIVAKGTIDERVLKALDSKSEFQGKFIEALKADI